MNGNPSGVIKVKYSKICLFARKKINCNRSNIDVSGYLYNLCYKIGRLLASTQERSKFNESNFK